MTADRDEEKDMSGVDKGALEMAKRHEPEGAEFLDTEYSNFDHVMPEGAEDALRSGKVIAHPAWDHWGAMWFEDGRFYERVMQYQSHVETVAADDLKSLFEAVNEKYGEG